MSERVSMHARVPRLVVSGTASNTGKTTVVCALLQALVDRGFRVRACKTGPDYIDPMFHQKVIGAESHNLDLFFSTEDEVRAIVGRGARNKGQSLFPRNKVSGKKGLSLIPEVTVVEGAMGYYDGIAVSDEASAWHVARALDAPAVLVVDARGRARSIGAEVAGYARFREPSQVRGVILNRCAPSVYGRLKRVIEEETGVAVFGYLPVLEDCELESRHLGLVTADEVAGLREKLAVLAAALEETVDVDGLVALAQGAPELAWDEAPVEPVVATAGGSAAGAAGSDARRPRIAVARDAAFCFYYDDALAYLEALGAELVPFSPLRDAALPEGVDGLYLGGGYPELHARELSENAAMRSSVVAAVRAGLPTVAECGGFMYLHEGIEDAEGAVWPQVGIVPGRAYKTAHLRRFGYVTLTAKGDSLLAEAGDELSAHEFHYWDSETCGEAFHAQKPQSSRSWDCVIATPTLYAGYPHLFLASEPKAARRFVAACAAHAAGGNAGAGSVNAR